MLPSRLPAAARKLSSRLSNYPLRKAPRRVAGIAPQVRLRAATPNPASRVKVQQSRVVPRSANSLQSLEILQSAFPKKTVIFVAVLGAAAYYFVDVRYADWVDAVLEVSHDALGTPLHFYPNRDELDHWIQAHIPDPVADVRDPLFLQAFNSEFERIVGGWSMTEEDALERNLPVTHGCQFKGSTNCEDYYALGTSPGPGSLPWNYWAVYDGHAGRYTSLYLQWHLIPQLSRALSNLSPQSSSGVISDAIKQAFVRVDDGIMARAKHAVNWYPAANNVALLSLSPAMAGSCAILASFDPIKEKLHVACTGDSRAVLGRWDPLEQKYVCKPLSVDQTGFNQSEVERIMAAHPDEPDIIDPKTGRLQGIAVTRAFGDHRWKWDSSFIKQVQAKFWGTAPRPKYETPPYMTAEPVVTETDVVRVAPSPSNPLKSDFMILASDGLWDRMSSEHAIECVSQWLSARDRGAIRPADFTMQQPRFTDEPGLEYDVETGKALEWKATPEYFAFEDQNAACCLLRNAMGGTRRGLFFGILSTPPPWTRDAMDDTTIMVVFFDKVEGRKEGQVAQKEGKKPWWKPW